MNNIEFRRIILSGFLVGFCCIVQSQILSFEDYLEIALGDGTNILLYKDLGSDENEYFYLPPSSSIRLATRENGIPEFLFAKYTTEERADAGGVQGAITHFLVEWGLTEDQLTELNSKLSTKVSGAKVNGPVRLKSEVDNSFSIVSATLNSDDFTGGTLITSGIAPPMPGNKAAVAAKLDKYGAQLLASTFEKSRSIADVSLVMNYTYTLYVDAVNASISCDWVQFERESESMARDYLRAELDNDGAFDDALNAYSQISEDLEASNLGCAATSSFSSMVAAQMAVDQINGDSTDVWLSLANNNNLQGQLFRAGSSADQAIGNTAGSGSSGSTYEYYVGESVMRNIVSFMYESEIIKLEYQESGEVDDEKIKTIRDAFFDYFLNSFAEQDFPQITGNRRTGIDEGEDRRPDDSEGAYSFRGCDQYESIKRKTKRIELSGIRLPVKLNHQMVENLASTYDQVRNNRDCIYSINLNDPFYSHREINFILDAESREIFEDEINFVTVNVRKRRSSGNDFQDAITIDAGDLERRGTLASLTYARGEDRNSDLYQYKVQWSLRGGNIHPANPQWINGDWQGVSLAAPIMPRNIEFEADLDELKEKGVRRVSLQLRYQKFGKEYESIIPLTVSRGNPLVEQTIYVDRDRPGYAYRIILTHQEHGKLALDWEGELTDDYVFAVLPDKLTDRRFIDRLSRAAQEFLPQSQSNVEILSPTERILDKVLKALEHFTN